MPNPKTFGDLRKDVDDLLFRIDRTRGSLDRKRAALEDLKDRISAQPDDAALDDVYGGEAARVDRASDTLNSIVNPEEIWPC